MSDIPADPDLKEPKTDDDLLALALKQFGRVVEVESTMRDYMVDDMRFRAGSPDNKYQWPTQVLNQREADAAGQRPCLTINKIPQHVNQVTNDIRQNRPAIKVIPVDDDGDVELAEMLGDLIRHIENRSNADVAYDTAADNSTVAGVGYIQVTTDYVDDNSFDQDIRIKRIRNPFTVYMDPDITSPDGADQKFCFVTEMMAKHEFKAEYPDAQPANWETLGKGDTAQWYDSDSVRVAEWWRVERTAGTLKLWANGATTHDDEDALAKGVLAAEQPIKTRKVMRKQVMFRKICGHQILEETEWAGCYIPIARVVGNEFDIEGKLEVSGLVRNAKDAQRMYNYWASQEVEMLALAPKAPFVGAAGQFDGFEDRWRNANTSNLAYLEYNPVVDTENGQRPFPAPQRVQPPMPSAGIMQAKMGASDDIKSATGQYDASLGAQGNETSGIAIQRRDHQSDVSTFHFVDNLSRAIRFVGQIIVDLIPKIYDTKRIARILGEDGETDMAAIDPSQEQAVQKFHDKETGQEIARIYNPGVGKYDVVVRTGPSYSTKRQEAGEAMQQMTQANPELWHVIGDLLVKNMDWPGAEEMAKRLKATLLPAVVEADTSDIPPQVMSQMKQMKEQLQQMGNALQHATQQLDQATQKNQFDGQKVAIDEYRAVTDRIEALADRIPADQLGMIDAHLVMDVLRSLLPQAPVPPQGMPMGVAPQPMPPQMPPQAASQPMPVGAPSA
ncbi:portal protein [Paraburkholderia metrosideri]|uniref:Portal protein n=1 Tax=Paraburkholderia metrosideri TaxID=580937 RepID=A0ABW9DVS7_9BURK